MISNLNGFFFSLHTGYPPEAPSRCPNCCNNLFTKYFSSVRANSAIYIVNAMLHSVEIQELSATHRFYVKSILAILKALILNLDFFKMSAFKKYTNSAKFRASVILNTYLIKMPGLL